MLGRNATVLWLSNASFYTQRHFSEGDFDIDVLSASTGPALVAPRAWRAKVNVQGDYIKLGGDHLATYGAVNPSLTWIFGKGELSWDSQFQLRDFERTRDAGAATAPICLPA